MDHFKSENKPEQAQGINSPAFQRERYETIVRETIREIYGNARYWEFFSSFNEESIHDFITEYATKKAWYLINGERALTNKTTEQFKFRDLAEKCFWEIQQKKLFNMQAEWRAGLIKIEGIEVTRDFLCWEHAITQCRFIEPVTSSDLELYLSYLDSGKFCEKGWLYNWQDYETFNNISLPAEVTPAWYQFYDEKRGTSYLKLLPDKKGEEERRYYNAWKESVQTEKTEMYLEDDLFSGPGPNLYMNYESLNFFIKTFEDKTVQKYFDGLETKPEDSILEAKLQEALRILNKAHEPVSLEESDDWRQAVIRGARKFKIKQIKSNLAVIFDEYKFRLQAGIEFNTIGDNPEYDEYIHYANIYKQQIQEGKKLLKS